MLFTGKDNNKSSQKHTYFIDKNGVIVFKTISNNPTLFPKKLARANEILRKATLLKTASKPKQ
jgi:hypothetical protein